MTLTLPQALERIAALEADVAYWRGEYEARFVQGPDVRLAQRYGVTPQQSLILFELKAAYPRPITFWALADRLPKEKANRAGDTFFVKTQVCRIRKAMGADVIDTVRNRGYALTASGLERVITA